MVSNSYTHDAPPAYSFDGVPPLYTQDPDPPCLSPWEDYSVLEARRPSQPGRASMPARRPFVASAVIDNSALIAPTPLLNLSVLDRILRHFHTTTHTKPSPERRHRLGYSLAAPLEDSANERLDIGIMDNHMRIEKRQEGG